MTRTHTSRPKKVLLWIGGIGTALLVTLAVVAWYFLSPVIGILYFNQGAAAGVCAQVVNGTLKPNSGGVISLPPGDSGLSLKDEVYTSTDPSGTVWILFRTWQGKGDNLHGYLYRSTPAMGTSPASVNALVPILRSNPADLPTGRLDLDVLKQVSPQWYEVRYDLD